MPSDGGEVVRPRSLGWPWTIALSDTRDVVSLLLQFHDERRRPAGGTLPSDRSICLAGVRR